MSELSQTREGFEAAVKQFESGWNAGDAEALASACHHDATFVNRFGRLVRGRGAIAGMHAPLFTSVYAGSVMACRVEEVEVLSHDAAYGYVRFDLSTSSGDVPGRMLAIVTQRGEAWAIQAVTNVAMVDPMTGQHNPNL